MSDPTMPSDSPWFAGAAPFLPPAAPSVRHTYRLQVRDHSLANAFALLMRSLPYAFARFAVLLAAAILGLIWAVVTFGGAAWLGTHVASAFAVVWLVVCVIGIGWFWATILRYALHLIACGHVAVLTALMTVGQAGDGTESQFAYGRRVVLARFGQVTALFALNAVVRGVLQAFHQTLDWLSEMLPIPGLESLASLLNLILGAATRYLDKVILSYTLARGDDDVWHGSRDGIIYYCQNAKPILQTSVWIVILERVLSFLLFVALLAPAAAITVILPAAIRQAGGGFTVVIALLLAAALRAAFIKPLFLIMIMIRFHALVEHQPINEDWARRLDQVSDKFRALGRGLV